MSSKDYPLKHVRLEQLDRAGLNVADFICFPPKTLKGREKELKSFFKKHGKISCRHFHEDEKRFFKCPVKYEQTDWQTILDFCMANNYGQNDMHEPFYTLCNEAIDLKDSICAGNIQIQDESSFYVDYFYGTGTPRDLESKRASDIKKYYKKVGEPAEGDKPPDDVMRMVVNAKKFRALDNQPYMFEFSIYPYPIGRNQENSICWEWRWAA